MDKAPNKYRSVCIYLALAFVTIAVFGQVRSFNFVNYDDPKYVFDNQHIRSGISCESIVWAFTDLHYYMWHPLTSLSHMLDCELFGLNPHWHHTTALFFHTANALLLFWVLKRMTAAVWQSAFVAALFALHPLNAESVAWIAERKNVLSTMFWILTMGAYIRYVKHPNTTRYLWTLLIFSLALMAKPTVVTLPFVLLLLDYWPLGRFQWKTLHRLVWEKIPFFILSAALSVVTFSVQHGAMVTVKFSVTPLHIRIANTLISYVKYIWKMFWPARLALPYPYHGDRLSMWQAVAAAVLLLVITVWVIRLARSRRYLPVGWLWYLGTLVPVIGLVQSGNQALADRYSYVPSIGLFIIIAWGLPELLAKWRYRKIALIGTALTVLPALAICTQLQLRHWRNTETLFEHALEVTDDNYVAHLCIAEPLYRQGRLDETIEHYSEALRIRPNFSNIHFAYLGLGRALFDQGKIDSAIVSYKEALRVEPDFVDGYKHLAQAFLRQGKLNAAAEQYRQALQLRPGEPDTLNNLGVVLALQNKFDEAITHFTRAVQLAPNLAKAHYHLAQALAQVGKTNAAVTHFKEALRASPDWLLAMNELAWILATDHQAELREPNEAIGLAERACELTNYQRPELLGALAAAYGSAGRFSDAVATAEKALKLAVPLKQKELTEVIQSHLRLYKANKPYIEAPSDVSAD